MDNLRKSVSNNIKEKNICPICYENTANIITECGHQFCKSCINILNYKGKINGDIIKIDVECFEIPVLNGAKQTILSQRPWIQIEGNSSGER